MSKWLECGIGYVSSDSQNKKMRRIIEKDRKHLYTGDWHVNIWMDGKFHYKDITAFCQKVSSCTRFYGLNRKCEYSQCAGLHYPELCLPDVTLINPWMPSEYGSNPIWKDTLLSFMQGNYCEIDARLMKKIFPKRETGELLQVICLYRDAGNVREFALETQNFYYVIGFYTT